MIFDESTVNLYYNEHSQCLLSTQTIFIFHFSKSFKKIIDKKLFSEKVYQTL